MRAIAAAPHRHTPSLAAVVMLALGACEGPDLCGSHFLRGVLSPSGRQQAVMYYRGCGTLAQSREGVWLLPAGAALPDSDGNIFWYYDTLSFHGEESNLADVRVEWTGENRLRISYDRRAGVELAKTKEGTIDITYVPFDKPPAPPKRFKPPRPAPKEKPRSYNSLPTHSPT